MGYTNTTFLPFFQSPNSRFDKTSTIRVFGSSKVKTNMGGSFDSEGLFDLEGMDDNSPTEIIPSEEETDTDGELIVTFCFNLEHCIILI